ncbi:MAG: hypothetical protein KF819_01275 [Labilithrix sp.]|nr:hypothetical protein [Labilithrix sp.]
MNRILLSFGAVGLAVALPLLGGACSPSLSQPFAAMKQQQQPITIYRLQNFEPPAAAAPNAAPAGIPPQIQQWLSAGAQLLPPGLLPPGLLPGGAPAPAAAANVPRFQNFRILGSMAVTDNKMREQVLDLLGHESNFEPARQSCMFAEFGFQIGAPTGGAPPADVLVSLSCDQVAMAGYQWPYGQKTGLTDDTSRKIVALVQKAFGG